MVPAERKTGLSVLEGGCGWLRLGGSDEGHDSTSWSSRVGTDRLYRS